MLLVTFRPVILTPQVQWMVLSPPVTFWRRRCGQRLMGTLYYVRWRRRSQSRLLPEIVIELCVHMHFILFIGIGRHGQTGNTQHAPLDKLGQAVHFWTPSNPCTFQIRARRMPHGHVVFSTVTASAATKLVLYTGLSIFVYGLKLFLQVPSDVVHSFNSAERQQLLK